MFLHALLPLLCAPARITLEVPQAKGRVWEMQRLSKAGSNGNYPMGENVFPAGFTAGDSSISFVDPAGGGSGKVSWTTMPKEITEGERVEITLSAENMTGQFTTFDSTGPRKMTIHGAVSPSETRKTISFVFTPWQPDTKSVNFLIETKAPSGSSTPTMGLNYGWIYVPKTGRPTPKTEATLTAHDYRAFPNRSVNGESRPENFMTDVPALSGVAADGVTLVVVRSVTTQPGRAIFRINGNSGFLYPIGEEDPFMKIGTDSVTVPTVEVGGKHVAVALYRPPSNFGSASTDRELDFTVLHQPSKSEERGAEAELVIKLVRPPVVLVHGTYDNPKYCWESHEEADDSLMNLAPRLRQAGIKDVFCVDWEETNGSKDPSSFLHNSKAIWENKNGIKDALAAVRSRGIAVTQADVICHSQGGVIARVYARGFSLMEEMSPGHPHFTDARGCNRSRGCWYHRDENYSRGDIHRLITISSTHRGSDVCRLFEAFKQFNGGSIWGEVQSLLLDIFLVFVDKTISGITTQGFLNQTPGSDELKKIGPTPVASHAIACVATDEDMYNVRPDGLGPTRGMGNYYGKLYKIWLLTPNDSKRFAFKYLADQALKSGDQAPTTNSAEFNRQLDVIESPQHKFETNVKIKDDRIKAIINHMRKTVFMDDENDCTVAMMSSYGGLTAPYTSKAEHVLHGWAPRYRVVQDRVIELLRNDGSLFDLNGFPNSYTGDRTRAGSWLVQDNGAIAGPPSTTSPPVTTTAKDPEGAKSIGGAPWQSVEGPWSFVVGDGGVTGKAWDGAFTFAGKFEGQVLKLVLTWGDQSTSKAELTFSADWKSFEGWYTHPDYGNARTEVKSSRGESTFAAIVRRWQAMAS